ncbi:uncharacterized protein EV422DRAFT_538804 [Fimicolochytrium jonesii]|uniref:uncharacterized protein n=1 Tax=Fimicolochytrium jonesii TaxID=1396493 RepID=UPI0022FE07EE|nr:uncharacterized protein EV422DRAFT_538804 [Fimicolochytrium jonesii]KAI8818121.1 hypothetical protein EV422DRAFT_538804 [Fimicolochytrium jonesii]
MTTAQEQHIQRQGEEAARTQGQAKEGGSTPIAPDVLDASHALLSLARPLTDPVPEVVAGGGNGIVIDMQQQQPSSRGTGPRGKRKVGEEGGDDMLTGAQKRKRKRKRPTRESGEVTETAATGLTHQADGNALVEAAIPSEFGGPYTGSENDTMAEVLDSADNEAGDTTDGEETPLSDTGSTLDGHLSVGQGVVGGPGGGVPVHIPILPSSISRQVPESITLPHESIPTTTPAPTIRRQSGPPAPPPTPVTLHHLYDSILTQPPSPTTTRFHCPFPTCPRTFSKRYNLRQHFSSIHARTQDRRYKCTQCDMDFSRKYDLQRHVGNLHPSERLVKLARDCWGLVERLRHLTAVRETVAMAYSAFEGGVDGESGYDDDGANTLDGLDEGSDDVTSSDAEPSPSMLAAAAAAAAALALAFSR